MCPLIVFPCGTAPAVPDVGAERSVFRTLCVSKTKPFGIPNGEDDVVGFGNRVVSTLPFPLSDVSLPGIQIDGGPNGGARVSEGQLVPGSVLRKKTMDYVSLGNPLWGVLDYVNVMSFGKPNLMTSCFTLAPFESPVFAPVWLPGNRVRRQGHAAEDKMEMSLGHCPLPVPEFVTPF